MQPRRATFLAAIAIAAMVAQVSFIPAAYGQDAAPDPKKEKPAAEAATAKTPAGQVVPDEYIVVLKPDAPAARQVAGDMATQKGLQVSHVYEKALNGYAATIPANQLASVKADPRVEYVTPNRTVRAIGLPGPGVAGATEVRAVAGAPAAAPPGNDAFASPVAATSLPFAAPAISTTEATMEGGEPQPSCRTNNTAVGKSVWYTLQLAANTQVSISTSGSSFDTVLAAYTGAAVNALTEVAGACNDDISGSDFDSAFVFTATANQLYRIQASGWGAAGGNLVLNVVAVVPAANDAFSNAVAVTSVPFNAAVSTTGSSMETGEPQPSCRRDNTAVGKSVWYRLQFPAASRVRISTVGSSFNTVAAVYTGSAVNALTEVPGACNDDIDADNGDVRSKVVLDAAANQVYRLQVSGFGSAGGNLVLNVTADAPAAQVSPRGLRRIGASTNTTSQTLSLKGAGVGVAVIDTGIDINHSDLRPVQAGKNCIDAADLPTDDQGHGSHVAGTIAARESSIGVVGVAPEVTLYPVKVLDSTGGGTMATVICGIDWVTQNAATIKIANMSLGGTGTVTPSNANCTNGNNDPEHTAICNSVKAGVTYVVAAGNSAANSTGFVPAGYEEVITVSALTDYNGASGGGAPVLAGCNNRGPDDSFATFSNFGPPVDIAAPGVCIQSTWMQGEYLTIDGTSMASPHVAGAAALIKGANPGFTPAQIKAALIAAQELGPIPGDPDAAPNKEGILKVSGLVIPPSAAEPAPSDFDADGRTDPGIMRAGGAQGGLNLWYAPSLTNGPAVFQIAFGQPGDIPVVGDYDGDGKADAVIYRPSTGLWYGPRTGAAQIVIQEINGGQAGDVPMPCDYDGDAKADPVYYRPSAGRFYGRKTTGGVFDLTIGAPGDVPVAGDFNGDGKCDAGIFRASQQPNGLWYAPYSGGGGAFQIYFGAPSDVLVVADYDGDGVADAAIYRPSNGLWYGPRTGAAAIAVQVNIGYQAGDVPVVGDYNNDDKADVGFWRPPTTPGGAGLWFATNAAGSTVLVNKQIGVAGDVPLVKR